jgi:hypothetical protein
MTNPENIILHNFKVNQDKFMQSIARFCLLSICILLAACGKQSSESNSEQQPSPKSNQRDYAADFQSFAIRFQQAFPSYVKKKNAWEKEQNFFRSDHQFIGYNWDILKTNSMKAPVQGVIQMLYKYADGLVAYDLKVHLVFVPDGPGGWKLLDDKTIHVKRNEPAPYVFPADEIMKLMQ